MPSLQDNIAAIDRVEIAKRAEAEAAFIAKINAARSERDDAALALEGYRKKLASLDGRPAESLPDDDKGLREHFLAIEVSKGRIKIGERKLELANLAVAEAEAEQQADRNGQGAELQLALEERERFIEDFDQKFPEHAKALFELIRSALHFEALAEAVGAGSAPRSLPQFDPSDPGFAQMRIALVTRDGTILCAAISSPNLGMVSAWGRAMNAMFAESSAAEADPIERTAERLRLAEGDVSALEATLARHTDDLNAVMTQIASASARGATAGELATACGRRLNLETGIRRASASLVRVRRANEQARDAHELACARAEKRAINAYRGHL